MFTREYKRCLETTTQGTRQEGKHFKMAPANGSNAWWEERVMREPINKQVFQNMANFKYLQVCVQFVQLVCVKDSCV